MLLTKPAIFIEKKFGEKPPNYRWNDSMEIKFSEKRNTKLYNQLVKMNCKAATGLAIAASEWILWRLCDWRMNEFNQNSSIQKSYLQALWVSLIAKEYLSKEKVTSNLGKTSSKIAEAIALMDYSYRSLKLHYIGHDPRIYGVTLNRLELARYVSDDSVFFDSWFDSCLTRSIELFPVPKDDLDEKGVFKHNDDEDFDPYLMINEPFIPREFYFEPDFDYQSADLKQLQAKLLNSVDYNENPFLSSPERMISIDFVGVPYQVND